MTWFESEVSKLYYEREKQGKAAEFSSLAVHFGLHDAEFRRRYPWAEGSHDAAPVEEISEVMKKFEVSRLFAGNWHGYAEWREDIGQDWISIVQVGSLCPTGWDNEGTSGYGQMVIQDGDNWHESITIPGPRFITVASEDQFHLAWMAAREAGDKLFVRWNVSSDHAARVLQFFKSACAEDSTLRDIVLGYDVCIDQKEAKVKAYAAAQAARSRTTLLDVASEYVNRCELPDGARREQVWNHTKRFLRL